MKKNILFSLIVIATIVFSFQAGQKNLWQANIIETSNNQIISKDINNNSNTKKENNIELIVEDEKTSAQNGVINIKLIIPKTADIERGMRSFRFKIKFLADIININDIDFSDSSIKNWEIKGIENSETDYKNGIVAIHAIAGINDPAIVKPGKYLLAKINTINIKDGFTDIKLIKDNYFQIKKESDKSEIVNIDNINIKNGEYFITKNKNIEETNNQSVLILNKDIKLNIKYIGNNIFMLNSPIPEEVEKIKILLSSFKYNIVQVKENLSYLKIIPDNGDMKVIYTEDGQKEKIKIISIKNTNEIDMNNVNFDLNLDGKIDFYDSILLLSL